MTSFDGASIHANQSLEAGVKASRKAGCSGFRVMTKLLLIGWRGNHCKNRYVLKFVDLLSIHSTSLTTEEGKFNGLLKKIQEIQNEGLTRPSLVSRYRAEASEVILDPVGVPTVVGNQPVGRSGPSICFLPPT